MNGDAELTLELINKLRWRSGETKITVGNNSITVENDCGKFDGSFCITSEAILEAYLYLELIRRVKDASK